MNAEFIEALRQMEREKEIPFEVLIEALEVALATAYKKSFNVDQEVRLRVEASANKGGYKVYRKRTVVEHVMNPEGEITLAEAQIDKPGARLGETIEQVLTEKEMAHMSRIAAQTAKQRLVQHIRERERGRVYEEYADRIGEVLSGLVSRVDNGGNIFIEIGKMEAVLPVKEQIQSERYRVRDRIKALIIDVRQGQKGGMQVVVSRTHPSLVRQLFEMEVPEIHDNIVTIKSIAREPGQRTKIAVAAGDERVDAVGACVGHRGQRVQAVVTELGEEKIDIIRWNTDNRQLITESLSPAKVSSVVLDDRAKSALVVVPDNQLSLAIGKSGQNVRLAAKLTGWRIDIRSETQAAREGVPTSPEPEASLTTASEDTPLTFGEDELITFGDDQPITFGDAP